MRPSPKDRGFADLVKAYAAARGCSLRTAQRHCEKGLDGWKTFVGSAAVGVVKSPMPRAHEVTALASISPTRPPAGIVAYADGADASSPDVVLAQIQTMWKTHHRLWMEACGSKEENRPRDDGQMLVHAQACLKLKAAYDKAVRDHTQWQVEQRFMIRSDEFAGLHAEVLVPLANIMRSLPAELATSVNPQDPQFAMERIQACLVDRIEPALQRCFDRLDDYVSRSAA